MDNYTLEGRLREAIYAGDTVGTQRLIAQGADINAKDHHGLSPLHVAVNSNALTIAGMLIEQGADLNSHNEKMDMTPLHLAAFNGSVALAALLLSHGARIDVRNEAGETPIMIAGNMGHEGIINLLKNRQAKAEHAALHRPVYQTA